MYTFIFILGTIFGSFINLLIVRTMRGESIVSPRSHCDYCNHSLKALDLIPILSFAFLKGRCRYCGKKISISNPLLEILCGLFLIVSFVASRDLYEFVLLSLGLYTGLVIAIIDLKTMEYYSSQVYFLLGLGFLYRYIFVRFDLKFIKFFLIFSLAYLFLYKIFKDGLGDGDYFYYLGLSLFLESSYLLYFVLFSIWLGAIFGIFLGIRKKTLKIKMAFCPYIFLSFILILLISKDGVIL
ncbi:MAG: prepilin peptidase [Peptoniphilaceae bacterium]|nr:prepilin peptidase [Peptoniphilaceae bacterium]